MFKKVQDEMFKGNDCFIVHEPTTIVQENAEEPSDVEHIKILLMAPDNRGDSTPKETGNSSRRVIPKIRDPKKVSARKGRKKGGKHKKQRIDRNPVRWRATDTIVTQEGSWSFDLYDVPVTQT
ncbi:hypothetical protein ACFE04_008819 [Oxalis oulophora]